MNAVFPPLPLPPLAAALPEHPALGESVIYQINGLVVVFTALCIIWGLLELMALWFKRKVAAAKPVPATAPVAIAAPAAAGPADGLEPAVVAAMAAAVHATLGVGSRITSIVQVDAPDHGWGLEGRRQIHSARKVR